MAENKCDNCAFRASCRGDIWQEPEEKEKPPACFWATEHIQDETQKQLADSVISWIRLDSESKVTSRTVTIVTAINIITVIAIIIKLLQ